MKRKVTFGKWNIVVVAICLFWMGTVFVIGQDAFKLTQKEISQFKKANKYHYAGQQDFIKKKFKPAMKSFLKCIETFPSYSSAYYYLAKIAYQDGDSQKALTYMENAKTNYKYMSDLMANTQLEYLDTLRSQASNIQSDLENSELGITGAVRGEMEKSLLAAKARLSNPLVTSEQIPADYYFLHGNIFFKANKLKEAHDEYVEAIRLDPQHQESYNNLITIFYMAKQYPKAQEYLKKAEENKVNVNPKLKEAVLKALGN